MDKDLKLKHQSLTRLDAIDGTAFSKCYNDAQSILFFCYLEHRVRGFRNVAPKKNISTITKGQKQFGSVITDIPLGVISLSAYLKKDLDIKSGIYLFNVELNRLDEFGILIFSFFQNHLSQNSANYDERLRCYFVTVFASLQ